METARVDIRKLQLLNDRINQAIDALNQVRLSVHGLSHSSGQAPGLPFGSPMGQQQPFQQQFGQGFPQQGIFGQQGPFQGFSHSSPLGQQPWQQLPFQGLQSPYQGQQSPFLSQQLGQGIGVPGMGIQSPWPGFGGLSHSGQELSDPFLVARIPQTFPYAQYPYPPVISLY
jgi:hypothetical protein